MSHALYRLGRFAARRPWVVIGVPVRGSEASRAGLEGQARGPRHPAELIEAGTLTPVIDRTYPLIEAPDAIRHLEGGHAAGKIAIRI